MQKIKKSDLDRKLSQRNSLISLKSIIVLKEAEVEIDTER